MALTQDNKQVALETPLGKDVLVLRTMHGTEQLSGLFHYEIDAISERNNITFSDLLGKKVTVRVERPDGETRYFNGCVSALSQGANVGQYASYHLEVRPSVWLLSRSADCRIFQNMTVPDIVKDVLREAGLNDFEESLTGDYRTWTYCVQYRETGLNFICRLLEQEGIYFYFKHEKDKHTLVFGDSYSAHEPVSGYEKIPFYPPDADMHRERDHIQSLHCQQAIQPCRYALEEYDFENPRADLRAEASIDRSHEHADYEIFDYPGEYVKKSEGDAYARTRIEELQAEYEQVNGMGDARGLCTGALFSLTRYPRDDQNREYLVTSATYEIASDLPESSAEESSGAYYSCSFTAISSATPFRPPRVTPKPLVQGPQTAVVVGKAGEEIWTDDYGRVKVQFPWDRYGASDQDSSCWIRVSSAIQGSKWGMIHVPRLGQEVVVEFLEGDPDRPLITGSVINANQMPPYDLPGNKTQSGFKSRSTKGGGGANFNEIRFEDKAGEEELYLHAEKNHTNITENDRNEDVGNDRALHVGHDKSEVTDHDRTLQVGHDKQETIDNDKRITVGAAHIESIGASKTLDVGTNHDETIGGSKTLKVTGSHTETVAAAMNIAVATTLTETVGVNYAETVGAAMQLTIGAAMTETVGANKTQSIGGNKNVTIGAAENVKVGGAKSEDVGSSKSVNVGSGLTESIGAAHSETVKDAYSLKAKTISVVADDSIAIKTGSASISMKKDGTIVIKGKDITIDGSGKITIKAKDDIVQKGKKILQN